jgi:pimeloyl-ACP methyl ester carboxylesterase
MKLANSFPVGTAWRHAIGREHLLVRQDGIPTGTAIVLIHAFAGSMRQWDEIAASLATSHWVIRVDLLGHGGADKPESGYAMSAQAARITQILETLGVEAFVAVGQSGGSNVVVAMMEANGIAGQMKGAILIAAPPNMSFVNLPPLANIYGVPLLGALMWTITSPKMVADTMASLFAPNFGPVPEIVIEDFFAMTRTSYVAGKAALEGYAYAKPLGDRVRATGIPAHIVFGEQDQWIPAACVAVWQETTHASTQTLSQIGHTPPLEAAPLVAEIIARKVGDWR